MRTSPREEFKRLAVLPENSEKIIKSIIHRLPKKVPFFSPYYGGFFRGLECDIVGLKEELICPLDYGLSDPNNVGFCAGFQHRFYETLPKPIGKKKRRVVWKKVVCLVYIDRPSDEWIYKTLKRKYNLKSIEEVKARLV
jgi:hypothetical protein